MDTAEIEHLAQLARIELTDAEKASLVGDMQNIIAFIDTIKEADVAIDAAERVGAVHNVFRADEAPHAGGMYTAVLVAATPQNANSYVKVPKILEKRNLPSSV